MNVDAHDATRLGFELGERTVLAANVGGHNSQRYIVQVCPSRAPRLRGRPLKHKAPI